MTAEGDNSVLMQKVAKERLGELMKSKPKLPEIAADKKQFSNREFLHYLLETRELKLFGELGLKMAKAGKDGTFNTWMLEESDLIQGAARAYGDNLIATRCVFFLIKEKMPMPFWSVVHFKTVAELPSLINVALFKKK